MLRFTFDSQNVVNCMCANLGFFFILFVTIKVSQNQALLRDVINFLLQSINLKAAKLRINLKSTIDELCL